MLMGQGDGASVVRHRAVSSSLSSCEGLIPEHDTDMFVFKQV